MTERRAARLGLLAALAVAAAQLVVAAAWSLGHDDPTVFARTSRCLEREKGLSLEPTIDDPLASSAHGGTLRTTVEGNPVTIVVATSEAEVERVRAAYAALGVPPSRLDVHGRYVTVWQRGSSPTQRQVTYDCAY